jgi:WXG100 family type VII secretion target
MADKLNMQFQDMKNLAKKFDSFHKNIDQMTKEMKSIIATTIDGGKWQGESAKAFKEEYEKMKDNFNKFSTLCFNTGKAVSNTADRFMEADKNAANGLRGK